MQRNPYEQRMRMTSDAFICYIYTDISSKIASLTIQPLIIKIIYIKMAPIRRQTRRAPTIKEQLDKLKELNKKMKEERNELAKLEEDIRTERAKMDEEIRTKQTQMLEEIQTKQTQMEEEMQTKRAQMEEEIRTKQTKMEEENKTKRTQMEEEMKKNMDKIKQKSDEIININTELLESFSESQQCQYCKGDAGDLMTVHKECWNS